MIIFKKLYLTQLDNKKLTILSVLKANERER